MVQQVNRLGASLLMLGGSLHSPQSYAGTPLEALLPVSVEEAFGSGLRTASLLRPPRRDSQGRSQPSGSKKTFRASFGLKCLRFMTPLGIGQARGPSSLPWDGSRSSGGLIHWSPGNLALWLGQIDVRGYGVALASEENGRATPSREILADVDPVHGSFPSSRRERTNYP